MDSSLTKLSRKSVSRKVSKLVVSTLVGFCAGILLTYLLFIIFVVQLKTPLIVGLAISCLVGPYLTIGLGFSRKVRCTVLLALPELLGKRGRSAIVAYTIAIVFLGPVSNVTVNFKTLTDSLACVQDNMKAKIEQFALIAKQPLVEIKQIIERAIDEINKVAVKVKQELLKITDMIKKIVGTISDGFKWISSIVNFCEKSVATPFDRCTRALDDANDDCREKMGILKFLCFHVVTAKSFCYTLLSADVVCSLLDFITGSVVDVIQTKLDALFEEINHMFYVSVKFEHNFEFDTDTSKSLQVIQNEIFNELRARSSVLTFLANATIVWGIILIFVIFFRALAYRNRFLSENRYDNVYVTKELLAVNERRLGLGKEPILPLCQHEVNNYAQLRQFRLLRSERSKLFRSLPFLFITNLQIGSVILVDCGFFWLLSTIRKYGRKSGVQLESNATSPIYVTGSGLIREMFDGILTAFDPVNDELRIDPLPCLPHPHPVDTSCYFEILFLFALCYLSLLFEPYLLRLRVVVMGACYPQRAAERAVWLATQILRDRKSSSYGYQSAHQIPGYLARLKKWSLTKFRQLFRIERYLDVCVMCGAKSPISELVICGRLYCDAKYCSDCYSFQNYQCRLCKIVMHNGMGEVSQEEPSSDSDA